MVIDDADIEIYAVDAWRRARGGQHVARNEPGVIVVHTPTGIAVVVDDRRSQMACKVEAIRRLATLVDLVRRNWNIRAPWGSV